MLRVTVQIHGKVTILQCHGRLVTGDDNALLRTAPLSQADAGTTVLDLAQVDSIDAGGLGQLLDLSTWSRANGTQLKLINVTRRVREVLELTNLDRILEVGSGAEADSMVA
jgi:anti-anti-sigma factor